VDCVFKIALDEPKPPRQLVEFVSQLRNFEGIKEDAT
jgi:hypothetical protein